MAKFRPGDYVLHRKRLEWGPGVVANVGDVHRVAILFEHHGDVTIDATVAGNALEHLDANAVPADSIFRVLLRQKDVEADRQSIEPVSRRG